MEISDDIKVQIKAEEIFRQEVRARLESQEKKTRMARTLAFLNTGVGLWLLSTVAASLVSVTFTATQSHFEQTRERTERSEKVVMELHTRVKQINRILSTDTLISEVSEEGPEAFALIARDFIYRPPSDGPSRPISVHEVYPQFKGMSVYGLISDARSLITDRHRLKNIDLAQIKLADWDRATAQKNASIEELRKQMLDALNLLL